jgi:3-mercaptopyruvate sulfurtransferase SseA
LHITSLNCVYHSSNICNTHLSLDLAQAIKSEYVSRNILSRQAYEELLQKAGINTDTTLILYGDFNNWFAAFAFWAFKYYGYKDVRILNGGRKKWLVEDRPISKDVPEYTKGNFIATNENLLELCKGIIIQ